VEEEIQRLRETNARLNRRCQEYEAGLAEKLKGTPARSFGRGLAIAAATYYRHRAEAFEATLAADPRYADRLLGNEYLKDVIGKLALMLRDWSAERIREHPLYHEAWQIKVTDVPPGKREAAEVEL
jgi:hypothetical protein